LSGEKLGEGTEGGERGVTLPAMHPKDDGLKDIP